MRGRVREFFFALFFNFFTLARVCVPPTSQHLNMNNAHRNKIFMRFTTTRLIDIDFTLKKYYYISSSKKQTNDWYSHRAHTRFLLLLLLTGSNAASFIFSTPRVLQSRQLRVVSRALSLSTRPSPSSLPPRCTSKRHRRRFLSPRELLSLASR